MILIYLHLNAEKYKCTESALNNDVLNPHWLRRMIILTNMYKKQHKQHNKIVGSVSESFMTTSLLRMLASLMMENTRIILLPKTRTTHRPEKSKVNGGTRNEPTDEQRSTSSRMMMMMMIVGGGQQQAGVRRRCASDVRRQINKQLK